MAAIWTTDTHQVDEEGGVVVMSYEQTALPGELSVNSPNEDYQIVFQEDGNLVLIKLPDTILWATATEDRDATSLVMQDDGNLVIYADAEVLWASDTQGNPGAYLALGNDGNLAVYCYGGIEQIGILTIEPNWQTPVSESLAWNTSLTESPLSVEQRMGLRLSPRKMIEMDYTLYGEKRSLFDLLMTAGSGSPMYVPLFYDIGKLTTAAEIGDTVIEVDTRWSELRDTRRAVLIGRTPFDYEVVEIFSFTDDTIVTVAGLQKAWPRSTKVFPLKRSRVDQVAQGDRYADKTYKCSIRFVSLEPNFSSSTATLGEYLDQPVLEMEPNDAQQLAVNYDRKIITLDNNVGLQQISDVAPYSSQAHSFFAKKRQGLWALRGILYALEGRRRPLWIPSFFADFELTDDAASADTTLVVKRTGFADLGGPFRDREHILIHLRDGTRLYRKILASAQVGDDPFEELSLDSPIGVDITPNTVLRISFITFCRQDQDTIELVHHTDTKGLTTATTAFRLDPGINALEFPEVPPGSPPDPGLRRIYDRWRKPDSKLWLYNPGFAGGGNDLINTWWQSRRPDGDIGFDGYAFPSGSVAPTGQGIGLPDTGSVLVRLKLTFAFSFGVPNTMRVWFSYENSTLDDVEVTLLGSAFGLGFYAEMQSDRNDIVSSKIDPDLPIVLHSYYQGVTPVGPANCFPRANLANDPEPYHTSGDGDIGDSAWVIEWWEY